MDRFQVQLLVELQNGFKKRGPTPANQNLSGRRRCGAVSGAQGSKGCNISPHPSACSNSLVRFHNDED